MLGARRVSVFVLMTLFAVILFAHPMIDQEQVNVDPAFLFAIGGGSEQKLAQVFTAGRGGRLTHVTLPIGCQPTEVLRVSIQETTAGVPNGNILSDLSLPGTIFPPTAPSPGVGFRIVELRRRPRLLAGQQYAIVLEAGSVSCYVYPGPVGDSYPAGSGYFDARPNGPGWLPILPNNDLPFQTFME